jgi:hypothetical protein
VKSSARQAVCLIKNENLSGRDNHLERRAAVTSTAESGHWREQT